MSAIDFPYGFDVRGHTAAVSGDAWIRDMIEQVLFTEPGERVNRPDFGTGLSQLLFAGNSVELVTATQMLVASALQQQLGDLIQVEEVSVTVEESALTVVVVYVVRINRTRRAARFSRPV
jgi:phage baseplate assembly protein W